MVKEFRNFGKEDVGLKSIQSDSRIRIKQPALKCFSKLYTWYRENNFGSFVGGCPATLMYVTRDDRLYFKECTTMATRIIKYTH